MDHLHLKSGDDKTLLHFDYNVDQHNNNDIQILITHLIKKYYQLGKGMNIIHNIYIIYSFTHKINRLFLCILF